jgi:hypothetical protein
MALVKAFSHICAFLGSLPHRLAGRSALAALLVASAVLQGYSLEFVAISLTTEETKSSPVEENDDPTENAARTHFAASHSSQKRLLQQHGKSTAFVRPMKRAAYSERSSQSVIVLAFGGCIHAVPMRC